MSEKKASEQQLNAAEALGYVDAAMFVGGMNEKQAKESFNASVKVASKNDEVFEKRASTLKQFGEKLGLKAE